MSFFNTHNEAHTLVWKVKKVMVTWSCMIRRVLGGLDGGDSAGAGFAELWDIIRFLSALWASVSPGFTGISFPEFG